MYVGCFFFYSFLSTCKKIFKSLNIWASGKISYRMMTFRKFFSFSVAYRKPGFLEFSVLFDVIFYVWHLFAWPYLLKHQQINGSHNQHSAGFNLSRWTFFTCIQINVLHWGQETSRGIFLCFINCIFRSKSTSLSLHTRLPLLLRYCCCFCCWAFSGNVLFLLFFQPTCPYAQSHIDIVGDIANIAISPSLGLACAWHCLTACICGCTWTGLF